MLRTTLAICVAMALSACSWLDFRSAPEGPGETDVTAYLETHDDPRLESLWRAAMELERGGPVTIRIVPSLFDLMMAFQSGEISASDLERTYIYVQDAAAHGPVDRSFRCISVDDVSNIPLNRDSRDRVYEARYGNGRLDVDPFVIWINHRPQPGDVLDVDFLMYFAAISYSGEDGSPRQGLLFVRPPWAGENGDTVSPEGLSVSAPIIGPGRG